MSGERGEASILAKIVLDIVARRGTIPGLYEL